MILSANSLSNQANDIQTAFRQKQQPLYDLLNSIQTFLQDGSLEGEGYTGAKSYFEGYYLPVIRGLILVSESFQENTAKCLSQLAQLGDPGLVIDTEALQEDIHNLRQEWMRLFELDQGLDLFLYQNNRYYIEDKIREVEKKIQEVYDYDCAMQGVYNGTEECLEAVSQGLSQISRGCYDGKSKRFIPAKDNMKWADYLNQSWETRSIDFKSLNSEFWNRQDGFFDGKWWQDDEKLMEAIGVLEKELAMMGGIDLVKLDGAYTFEEVNQRMYAIQAIANAERLGYRPL